LTPVNDAVAVPANEPPALVHAVAPVRLFHVAPLPAVAAPMPAVPFAVPSVQPSVTRWMPIVCEPVVSTGVSEVTCSVAELIVYPVGIVPRLKRISARRRKPAAGPETVPAGRPTTNCVPAPLLLPVRSW
jgi:hypothetical protein